MAADNKPDPSKAQAAAEEVAAHSRIASPAIYEVLRREGEEEMDRPLSALWWSGVAAGLSLSLSLLAQGVLQAHLPDTVWRPLVASLGYTVGFLVAVMARHQLFTENTLTAVLPVTSNFTVHNLLRTGRLWGVVLAANFVGTFAAALVYGFTPIVPDEVRTAMLDIARHAMAATPPQMFSRAIAAGFIIAAMVWLLPSAQQMQVHVVILLTYFIAAAELAHIVAGSLEAFLLVLGGEMDVGRAVFGFAAPVLAGNIIGGTLLFALISYAQVAKEIDGGGSAA